jgi:hypothetical protein
MTKATFKWKACPGSPPLRGTGSVGQLTFSYNRPSELSGEANVAPDVVSLFFTSDQHPHLEVTDVNYNGPGRPELVFKADINCIGTSAIWAAIRQGRVGSGIHDLPLYLETQ